MSDAVEWTLLVVGVIALGVGAIALTARHVGGWQQLCRQRFVGPNVPARYVAAALVLAVLLVVLVDPADDSVSIGSLLRSGAVALVAVSVGYGLRATRRKLSVEPSATTSPDTD